MISEKEKAISLKSLILTGATGSIGLAIIRQCIANNIDVLVIINPNSLRKKNIPNDKRVCIVECDLSNLGNLEVDKSIMERFEGSAFIHLAWMSTSNDTDRNRITPQIANIQYAVDAVELANKLGCISFVGSGSQAQYGRTDEVLTETTPMHPETAYGMAKLCAEQMTRLACKQFGIRHVWPRILSTYGPYSGPNTVINYTIDELLNNRSPELTRCEQIWDFIYVDDAARALLLLAEYGHDGEAYVIGYGKSSRLENYMNQISEIVGASQKLGIGEREYGENTVMHLECDIYKLTKDTSFVPQIEFEEGIRRILEWKREK